MNTVILKQLIPITLLYNGIQHQLTQALMSSNKYGSVVGGVHSRIVPNQLAVNCAGYVQELILATLWLNILFEIGVALWMKFYLLLLLEVATLF